MSKEREAKVEQKSLPFEETKSVLLWGSLGLTSDENTSFGQKYSPIQAIVSALVIISERSDPIIVMCNDSDEVSAASKPTNKNQNTKNIEWLSRLQQYLQKYSLL